MSKGGKIGVVLMLIGFCIPMLSMLFASDYHPKRGEIFISIIKNTDIVCWKTGQEPVNPYLNTNKILTTEEVFGSIKTYCVPLSLSFGLGIVLIATGIGLFVLSKKE
jgi:hypothetical protein